MLVLFAALCSVLAGFTQAQSPLAIEHGAQACTPSRWFCAQDHAKAHYCNARGDGISATIACSQPACTDGRYPGIDRLCSGPLDEPAEPDEIDLMPSEWFARADLVVMLCCLVLLLSARKLWAWIRR